MNGRRHALLFSDHCDGCDARRKPGDEMVFYPDKTALCLKCAEFRAETENWTLHKARVKR